MRPGGLWCGERRVGRRCPRLVCGLIGMRGGLARWLVRRRMRRLSKTLVCRHTQYCILSRRACLQGRRERERRGYGGCRKLRI